VQPREKNSATKLSKKVSVGFERGFFLTQTRDDSETLVPRSFASIHKRSLDWWIKKIRSGNPSSAILRAIPLDKKIFGSAAKNIRSEKPTFAVLRTMPLTKNL
jgi:hypothetical protein